MVGDERADLRRRFGDTECDLVRIFAALLVRGVVIAPSVARLAQQTGRTERCVQLALATLQAAGEILRIMVQGRTPDGGRLRAITYLRTPTDWPPGARVVGRLRAPSVELVARVAQRHVVRRRRRRRRQQHVL